MNRGGGNEDPIKEFIKKVTYGYCSNYTYDNETGLVTVEEPKDIPKIFITTFGMGYDYRQEEDSASFRPGGNDRKNKITLNGNEINGSELFNGDSLVYEAIIAGSCILGQYGQFGDMDVEAIMVPIILINLNKESWSYSNSNINVLINQSGEITNIASYIDNIHFTPEEH